MPLRWLRAHIISLPQVQAEYENIHTSTSAFPHLEKGARTQHVNSLRVRLSGAWTFTREGKAYDHRGNLMMQTSQDVRRWFRSIGW